MAAGCAVRISDDLPLRKQDEPQDAAADAPVLLLLHGYLGSLESWEAITPMLRKSMRVVAVDLPGNGISEVKGDVHTMAFIADVVHGVLETLGVQKCFVCGHSMGGYAALELLRSHPDALEGIILLHSTPNPDTEERKRMRQREIEIVLAGKKDILFAGLDKVFAAENRKRLADEIAGQRETAEMTDEEGIVALLRGMMERGDNNEMLRASGIPQMFIFGRHDELITPEAARELIEAHPQAEVVWLERSGHMGPAEEPAAVAEAVISFVARHSGK